MATFSVEDGTGLDPTSNSYASVQNFKDYHNERGNDISSLSSGDIQKLLVKASSYIDQRWGRSMLGTRLVQDQPMEFPRDELYGWDGYLIEGVPWKLIYATAEYALAANSASLWLTPTNDATGQIVKRKKIGPIETEFMEGFGKSSARIVPEGDYWMSEYTRGGIGSVYRA